MFERFTERARRVLFFARYEASQLGGMSIEPEHLLLGLLREGKGLTSRVFASANLSLEDIRREIEGRTVFRERLSTSVEIPFSPSAKRVLQFTAEESERLLHDYIGTEHLLLGILREQRSAAASILNEKGLRLDAVRDDVVRLLRERRPPDDAGGMEPHGPIAMHGTPNASPSFDLHVYLSARSDQATTSGPRYWTAVGFTLRSVLARLHGVEEQRIDLPDDLDTGQRYDFVLHLPAQETWSRMERRVVDGIQRHFRISIVREHHEQDVYVLTAPKGPSASLRREENEHGGGAGGASFDFTTVAGDEGMPPDPEAGKPASFGNLRMSGLTIADLCAMLEDMFQRPFVDETNLPGTYDVAVEGEFRTPEDFFAAMSRQLGLQTAPGRRALGVVVVRHA